MPKRVLQEVRVEKVPSRRLASIVTKQFLHDFKRHGIATIEQVRKDNPSEYLRIITKLLPKQLDVGVQHSFSDVLVAAAEQIRREKEIDQNGLIVEAGGGTGVEGLTGSHARENINIYSHAQISHEVVD